MGYPRNVRGCTGGKLLAYQVIARKWRPQSFHDLVGQEHIATTLINALRNQRLPQAILFTGVRGTGKTSSARILAKSLRCQKAVDFVPCDHCSDCLDIAQSRSLDVIEIDGASNNGVDAIRELRETVGYMPSSGKFKIYIIDEVHMLSTSAFNALLKTLEEPPAHVVFVMATTEAQKIPNTILSRCQRFDFRRIPSRLIAEQLTKICRAEGVQTENEALWLIARQGDGSMRDSQSLLDQVITFSNAEVTLEKTISILGLTDRAVLQETLQGLVDRDGQKIVDVIEKLFRAGYDPKVFAQDFLEEIRNTLLVRLCEEDPSRVVDLPDIEIHNLKTIAADLSNEDLHLLFDMTLKGVNDLLRAQDPRIVLEMLLLRMAEAPRIASLAALAQGHTPQPPPTPVRTSASGSKATKASPPSSQASGSIVNPTTSTKPIPTKEPLAELSSSKPSPSVSELDASKTATTTHSGQAPSSTGTPPTGNNSAVSLESSQYSYASFVRAAPGYTGPLSPKDEVITAPSSGAMPASAPTTTTQTKSTDQETIEDSAIRSQRMEDPWYRFVDRIKKSNSLLGAMLENTHLLESNGSQIVIGVPRKMSFMLDKVKEPENIKRIESFLETLWNKKYSVEVRLADAKVTKSTPKAMADEQKAAQKKSVEQAVEQDPLVKAAQNVFKAQIKSIKNHSSSKSVSKGESK